MPLEIKREFYKTFEADYVSLVKEIIDRGEAKSSRAGDTLSTFGARLVFDLQFIGFPVLKGRKLFYKQVLGELAAMLQGPKSTKDFKKYGCNYWDKFASAQGELDLDYGNSWLDFNGINQLEELVKTLKTNPNDRRMLITGWRPDRLKSLSLPCCHMLYQWYVRDGKYLDMMWYQRSVDVMVGLPSDAILAAAWNILLANDTGYLPGKVTMFLGDTHIYLNHLAKSIEYIKSAEDYLFDCIIQKETVVLAKEASVFNFEPGMLDLPDYKVDKVIKFELNV